MNSEWPFTDIRDIKWSAPEDWEADPIGEKYVTPAWVHESGLILAIRGPTTSRITLYPPHDDPREAEELDGYKYERENPVEHVRNSILPQQ